MQQRNISAAVFSHQRSVVITWNVYGCNWTGLATCPKDPPPFDLDLILGTVDTAGVFRSTNCSGVNHEGRRISSVRIEFAQSDSNQLPVAQLQ